MSAPVTYSFLDTLGAIAGPGGGFSIGSDAGVAEEGITIAQAADMNAMTIGADGSGMHSLIANRAGTITIRLLKTSPVNAQLMAMAQFQRTSAANHGQNTISIVNKVSGDAIQCELCGFKKIPDLNYATQGGMNEWTFDSLKINPALGAGVA